MRALTEDQIERRVERFMDHWDAVFLSGGINQDTYDKGIRDLHQWAEAQYNHHEE